MFAGRNSFMRNHPPPGPFPRGVFKYIILQYLRDRPRHGYEIIRAMEERFHGLYVPSAGTIYPRLQVLEEKGMVTSTEQEGKKVYAITAGGLSFLEENAQMGHALDEHLKEWFGEGNKDERQKTMLEFGRLADLFRWNLRKLDSLKLEQLRGVLSRAYKEIEQIAGE